MAQKEDLKTEHLQVGVFSTGFVVPQYELKWNLQHLSQIDFKEKGTKISRKILFEVDSSIYQKHLFFSGNDTQRTDGFWSSAISESHSILWSARGGYGSLRVLEGLNLKVKQMKRPPEKKLLVGFSDLTVLQAYVTDRWGWNVLHASMLCARNLSVRRDFNWAKLLEALSVWEKTRSWKHVPVGAFKTDNLTLKPVHLPKGFRSLEGRLIGGNLASWVSILGGPFHPKTEGAILFFEDVGEDLYRIDRLLQQLRLLGGLRGVQGIVLGDFTSCLDSPANCLKRNPAGLSEKMRNQILASPKSKDLKPLRKKLNSETAVSTLFRELGVRENLPIARGIPSGHDPRRNEPLIMNEIFCMTRNPSGGVQFRRMD